MNDKKLPVQTTDNPVKMKKVSKMPFVFAGVALAVILGVFFLAAYLGFVPGLSSIFLKQTDLGITSDPSLVQLMNRQIGFVDNLSAVNPASGELKFTGKIGVNRQFTSEELTAYINVVSAEWALAPYKNVQVRVNSNGDVEMSGVINKEKAIARARAFGYSDEQIKQAQVYIALLPDDIPFYGVASGTVANNVISIDVKSAKFGNISVPETFLDELAGGMENVVYKRMSQIPELNIMNIEVKDGKVVVRGFFPRMVEAGE